MNLKLTAGHPRSRAVASQYFLGRRGQSHMRSKTGNQHFFSPTFSNWIFCKSISRFLSEIGGNNNSIPHLKITIRYSFKKNYIVHFELHAYKMKIADAIFIVKKRVPYLHLGLRNPLPAIPCRARIFRGGSGPMT